MSYKVMYGLAVGVAIAGAMLAAIQAAGPQNLGIGQSVINWLGVLNSGLIILASILPSVRTPPTNARQGMD